MKELQQWEAEQAAEWTYVPTRDNHGSLLSQQQRQAPVRLTGANAIPIPDPRLPRSSPAMAFSNFKPPINGRRSALKRLSNGPHSYGHNYSQSGTRPFHGLKSPGMHNLLNAAGILGPVPDPSKFFYQDPGR
jgi:hypothetical protein